MPEFTATLQAALAPSYTLERELTGGGMSRVFVATDNALGRKVVVKVLPPELAAGVNHERFRREIQVAAQLQHPHVVPLLSAGEEGALIWYTMPYINGHSLREAIAKGERFSVKDVIRIMREVAEGLDYAHALGVIHRDIKPGNVLMQGTHALVTDFGVSKAISASMPASGYTSAGMAIGTPAYMAPEQIAADPAANHRMDLYALGLLSYELLTGKVPFKEASPQQTMAAQLTRDPVPIEQLRGDVPPALLALIRRLLAKLPDDRPATASEVVQALDAIPLSGETQAFAVVRPASALRSVTLVAGAAVLIAGAWLLGQRQGTEATVHQLRDSLAVAESLQAVAPAAAMLTRDDSIAIARAVSARMAAQPTAAPQASDRGAPQLLAMADSLRAQIQREVLDSLVRFQTQSAMRDVASSLTSAAVAAAAAEASEVSEFRIATSEPARRPRRVVVAIPRSNRSRPDLDAVAATLADTLRRAIDAQQRYEVVPEDSVAAVLRESRTINSVQERLSADLFVSIALIPARDSLVRLIQVRDLSAPRGSDMQVVAATAQAGDPTAGLDLLVPRTLRALAALERGPRVFRAPPPTPRPPREALRP